MSTMAEVILEHRFTLKGSCACGAVMHDLNPERIARHLADALTEAGYGKLEDGWDAGYMRGQYPWTKESQEVDPIPTYMSPPTTGRNANPYRVDL